VEEDFFSENLMFSNFPLRTMQASENYIPSEIKIMSGFCRGSPLFFMTKVRLFWFSYIRKIEIRRISYINLKFIGML